MENNKDQANSGSESKKSASNTGLHGADSEECNKISPGKSQASRNNGRKSKGPKTARGKSISRWNSLKHGLYTKSLIILEGKHLTEYTDYEQLLQEIMEELKPTRVEDRLAIEKQVMDTWRLRRSFKFELTATEKEHDGMASICMPNVLRYSVMAHRQWTESHQQLCEIRERTEHEVDTGQVETEATAAGDEPPEEQNVPGTGVLVAGLEEVGTDHGGCYGEVKQSAQMLKPLAPQSVTGDSAGEGVA
jgi:hypothetical protein